MRTKTPSPRRWPQPLLPWLWDSGDLISPCKESTLSPTRPQAWSPHPHFPLKFRAGGAGAEAGVTGGGPEGLCLVVTSVGTPGATQAGLATSSITADSRPQFVCSTVHNK